MIKRHEAAIRNAIDELTIIGHSKLSKAMLRHWYKQDRMSKTVWRDIAEKLPEEWSPADVLFFEWEDEIILLDKTCIFEMSENV